MKEIFNTFKLHIKEEYNLGYYISNFLILGLYLILGYFFSLKRIILNSFDFFPILGYTILFGSAYFLPIISLIIFSKKH